MALVLVEGHTIHQLHGPAIYRAMEVGRELAQKQIDIAKLHAMLQRYVADAHGVITTRCESTLNYRNSGGVAFYGELDLKHLFRRNATANKHRHRLAGLGYRACCEVKQAGVGGFHHCRSMEPVVTLVPMKNPKRRRQPGAQADADHKAALREAKELEHVIGECLENASQEAGKLAYEELMGAITDLAVMQLLDKLEAHFTINGDYLPEAKPYSQEGVPCHCQAIRREAYCGIPGVHARVVAGAVVATEGEETPVRLCDCKGCPDMATAIELLRAAGIVVSPEIEAACHRPAGEGYRYLLDEEELVADDEYRERGAPDDEWDTIRKSYIGDHVGMYPRSRFRRKVTTPQEEDYGRGETEAQTQDAGDGDAQAEAEGAACTSDTAGGEAGDTSD